MKCTVIVDRDEGLLNAVILSNVTTSQELENILGKIKQEKPGEWDYEDFIRELPGDCEFYYSWEAETIFD